MPQRIQRKRTKGWRMPEGAVYVGRPSKWGNPFIVARSWRVIYLPDRFRPEVRWETERFPTRSDAVAYAVEQFALYVGPLGSMELDDDDLSPLRGRDLACWCPLDQPCHADVLLALANGCLVSFTDRDGNAVRLPCEGLDYLFERPGEPGRPGPNKAPSPLDAEAKALCGRYPAVVACLATATLDDLGIRGGRTWDERRALGQRTKPQYRRATRGVA